MKLFKILAIAGLMLAVTGTAGAVTLPTGFIAWNARNQDNGTTYTYTGLAPGATITFAATSSDPNVHRFLAADGKVIPGSGSPGVKEDSWGIALIYSIAPGALTNPGDDGSIVENTGAPATYTLNSTSGTWLTAMFHGGSDTMVTITAGSGSVASGGNGIAVGNFSETIQLDHLQFELFAVDFSNLSSASGPVSDQTLVQESSARHTAADQYVGWTHDAAGNPLGTLMLTGSSNYFASTVVVNGGSGAIVGASIDATTAYFDVPAAGPGLWNPILGATDELLTPSGDPSNIWFQWTLINSTRGWAVKSNDAGGTFAIPEPLTMLGLFLGVTGLGGYIRRRTVA